MKRVFLALAALLFASSAVITALADVAGNWRVEFVIPKGEMGVAAHPLLGCMTACC